MEITYIGPWIVLSVGVMLAVVAVYVAVAEKKGIFSFLAFAGLFAGVGIHGPLFIGQYAEFLRVISPMVETPGAESYQNVFDSVGQGNFDPELQEIALAYALDRPIADMDTLLTGAIDRATSLSGQRSLMETQAALQAKAAVANRLAREVITSPDSAAEIEAFDPATRTLVAEELLTIPPEELQQAPNSGALRLQEWVLPRAVRASVQP